MAQPNVVPSFSPQARPTDFFQGATLPFRAAGLIFKTPKLFTLSAISGVITFVSLGVLVWLLATYTDDLLARFWVMPETWYGRSLWYLVLALAFVGLFVAGMNTVPLALQAPIQDPISEATEDLCGDFQSPGFSVKGVVKSVSVGLIHTLTRIGTLILGQAVLFLLNFIPGIGSVLWTVAGSLWTMVWAAGEYLGAPMARHLYPFREVRQTLRKRRALTLGFGAAVYLILWVPILNLFFVPMAIVGGTLLYRGLRACGSVGPPPSPASSKTPSGLAAG